MDLVEAPDECKAGDLGSDRSFLNFAVADAGGANAHAFSGTLDECVDGLQVQIPATLRYVVGMADPMPELRSATADFTNSCHKNTLRTHSRRARLSSTVPLPQTEGQPGLLVRERFERFRQRLRLAPRECLRA